MLGPTFKFRAVKYQQVAAGGTFGLAADAKSITSALREELQLVKRQLRARYTRQRIVIQACHWIVAIGTVLTAVSLASTHLDRAQPLLYLGTRCVSSSPVSSQAVIDSKLGLYMFDD